MISNKHVMRNIREEASISQFAKIQIFHYTHNVSAITIFFYKHNPQLMELNWIDYVSLNITLFKVGENTTFYELSQPWNNFAFQVPSEIYVTTISEKVFFYYTCLIAG